MTSPCAAPAPTLGDAPRVVDWRGPTNMPNPRRTALRTTLPALAGWLLCALGPLSAAAQTAAAAHAKALHACPTVHREVADLDMLADGLAKSDAVGLFEKVRLKSAIDELIGRLKAFHGGARSYTLAQLQEQYDVLMMRIATQLQDKDAALHGRLCNAWDSIWATLQDRDRFMRKFS